MSFTYWLRKKLPWVHTEEVHLYEALERKRLSDSEVKGIKGLPHNKNGEVDLVRAMEKGIIRVSKDSYRTDT